MLLPHRSCWRLQPRSRSPWPGALSSAGPRLSTSRKTEAEVRKSPFRSQQALPSEKPLEIHCQPQNLPPVRLVAGGARQEKGPDRAGQQRVTAPPARSQLWGDLCPTFMGISSKAPRLFAPLGILAAKPHFFPWPSNRWQQ